MSINGYMYVYEPHGTRLIGFLFELFLFWVSTMNSFFHYNFFMASRILFMCDSDSDSVNHLINSYLFIRLTELRDFLFIR